MERVRVKINVHLFLKIGPTPKPREGRSRPSGTERMVGMPSFVGDAGAEAGGVETEG